MENIPVQTLYQLCAVVDAAPGVSTPPGWRQTWGHLPPAGQKPSGNYAALYQKWVMIGIPPFAGPFPIPVPVYALAIQGTQDGQDILEDFEVEHQVPFAPVPTALISKGSGDALDDLLQLPDDKTGVTLRAFLPTLPANSYLVVTGHSLGGNLASVLGPWVAVNVPNFTSPDKPDFPAGLGVVTFAAPTAGNLAFAEYLNRQTTYDAHFNVNDVVSNVWAVTGELSLASAEQLFPAPGPHPAPLLVRGIINGIRDKMAKNGVSYTQTRGTFFAFPSKAPPSGDDPQQQWRWELNYQHNIAYDATFLPPAGGAEAAAG